MFCLIVNQQISYLGNPFPEPVHSILGPGGVGRKPRRGGEEKNPKPFKINPSKEDTEKQMLNVTILTAEIAG